MAPACRPRPALLCWPRSRRVSEESHPHSGPLALEQSGSSAQAHLLGERGPTGSVQRAAGSGPPFSLTCLRACDGRGRPRTDSKMRTPGKGMFLKHSRSCPRPFPQGEGLRQLTLGVLLSGKSGHGLPWLPPGPRSRRTWGQGREVAVRRPDVPVGPSPVHPPERLEVNPGCLCG